MLIVVPAVASAQFNYAINDDGISLSVISYTGSDGVVNIPSASNNIRVTSIGVGAFFCNSSITSLTIPGSVTSIGNSAFTSCVSLTNVNMGNGVTNIGDYAFYYCPGLTSITLSKSLTYIGDNALADCDNLSSVYFLGNAPGHGVLPFYSSTDTAGINATVYYMPNTAGWGATYGGAPIAGARPTILWNPQVLNDASFGVHNNQFGFNIIGISNSVIVIKACTNLLNAIWSPISTNKLNNFTGTNNLSHFSDPQWQMYPRRFYGFSPP